jgi:ubiquinone/menaquinone biosynthesis C-methylase UbiE
MSTKQRVKEFYDQLRFPGEYSISGIENQKNNLTNRYLCIIDNYIGSTDQVLDVGCGSGLVSNLLASRHPLANITAIDFSQATEYAEHVKQTLDLNNVKFVQQDFALFDTDQLYDTVICQGVLHHMPDWNTALPKLKSLVRSGGTLIVGLYHPWGKILKKFLTLDYGSDVLYQDQEKQVYEISFTAEQVEKMFQGHFDLIDSYPSLGPVNSRINALIKSKNGGLITYVFKKH